MQRRIENDKKIDMAKSVENMNQILKITKQIMKLSTLYTIA